MPDENELVVTTSWDDGTVTDLKLAELLGKYGIAATFYIPVSFPANLLSGEEITSLSDKFEIGAHSVNQPDLTKIPPAEASREIGDSKKYLEEILSEKVEMFAYPRGKYNENVKRIVKDAGFIGARTCDPGGLMLPSDPFQWHINMIATNASPLMTLKIFGTFRFWKISAFFDWESRAKVLFDIALHKKGVFHIYGHSADFEEKNEWKAVERVLEYFSGRKEARYLTNGEVIKERLGV